MVHSKGTRSESHLFRIDRTGRAKYSGRSRELLRLSAGGEEAARRAMPTSGAGAPGSAEAAASRRPPGRLGKRSCAAAGGGQSALRFGVLLLPGHSSGASPGTPLFGLCSGRIGKRLSELGTARRRRPENPGDGRGEKREERTGDIAHLVLVQYFAFSSLLSSYIFACYSPIARRVSQPSVTPVIARWPPGPRAVSLLRCTRLDWQIPGSRFRAPSTLGRSASASRLRRHCCSPPRASGRRQNPPRLLLRLPRLQRVLRPALLLRSPAISLSC